MIQTAKFPAHTGELLGAMSLIRRKRDEFKTAMERRKVYRATLHELSILTDRDLADLGIARSNIKQLAWESAYGA